MAVSVERMMRVSDVELDVTGSGVDTSLNHVARLAVQFAGSKVAKFARFQRNDAGVADSGAAAVGHEHVSGFAGLQK